jgi:hypothetical protein
MYSTLEDLLRFYRFVRSGHALSADFTAVFLEDSVNVDGSDRGFELFSAMDESGGDQVFILANAARGSASMQSLLRTPEELGARYWATTVLDRGLPARCQGRFSPADCAHCHRWSRTYPAVG